MKLNEKDASIVINLCSKICNTIMRKLSVTHDTEFRGKVHKFIAAVSPLTHPSGLNKLGNLNSKNETHFESLEEIKEQIVKLNIGQTVADSKFYRNFWNL
jgi:THO complex subunit 1 transcription elongation factor